MPQKCQIWQICGYRVCFFQALNTPKLIFGRGSTPDPAEGAYDAPPDSLVGWGGGHASAHRLSGSPTQIPRYDYTAASLCCTFDDRCDNLCCCCCYCKFSVIRYTLWTYSTSPVLFYSGHMALHSSSSSSSSSSSRRRRKQALRGSVYEK